MSGAVGPSARPPLRTGLLPLDRATGGAEPGHVWVLTGPAPGDASLLALGMAREVALRPRVRVYWLSTHDEPEDLRERVLAAEARVLLDTLRSGDLGADEQERLAHHRGLFEGTGLTFQRVSPSDLGSAAADAAKDAVTLLVLDQLFDTDVLGDLKRLAQNSATWVVAVAADDPNRLAAGRALRAGADVVLRVEVADPDTDRIGEVDIAVSRAGRRRAVVTVADHRRFSRFVDFGWR